MAEAAGQHAPRYLSLDGANSLSGVSHLVLTGHGRRGDRTVNVEGQRMTGAQLGQELLARGFKGDTVILVVCHAGAGTGPNGSGPTFAQELADELKGMTGRDIQVIAANDKVYNLHDGTLVTGSKIQDTNGNTLGYMAGDNGADFLSFVGGKPQPQSTPGTAGPHVVWRNNP
jgi:hypothetical protein